MNDMEATLVQQLDAGTFSLDCYRYDTAGEPTTTNVVLVAHGMEVSEMSTDDARLLGGQLLDAAEQMQSL